MTLDCQPNIEAQIAELKMILTRIEARLDGPPEPRGGYTVEEVATMLKKTPYTVREWCREGRINATKRPERRGGAELWNISAAEVARYKDEELLSPIGVGNARR